MGAYKNPLVVKEIYLPTEDATTTYTFDEYFAKFGININDLVVVKNNEMKLVATSKLYFVNISTNEVYPFIVGEKLEENPTYTYRFIYGDNVNLGGSVAIIINTDGSGNSIEFSEI